MARFKNDPTPEDFTRDALLSVRLPRSLSRVIYASRLGKESTNSVVERALEYGFRCMEYEGALPPDSIPLFARHLSLREFASRAHDILTLRLSVDEREMALKEAAAFCGVEI